VPLLSYHSADEIVGDTLRRFLDSLKGSYPVAVQAALDALGLYHNIEAAGSAFSEVIRQTLIRSIAEDTQILKKVDAEQRSHIRQLEAQVAQHPKEIKEILAEAEKYEKEILNKDKRIQALEIQIHSQNGILALEHERLMALLGNVEEDES
jgi:septal ring factor EnvC (AmiA/AmiB activator)